LSDLLAGSWSCWNFDAPLLVNHKEMLGKQVILTDSEFSVRQSLV
jgi:flagellar assembly factor FliW